MYTGIDWVGWANLQLTHSLCWTWEKRHELLRGTGFVSHVGKTIAQSVFITNGFQGVSRKYIIITKQFYKEWSLITV